MSKQQRSAYQRSGMDFNLVRNDSATKQEMKIHKCLWVCEGFRLLPRTNVNFFFPNHSPWVLIFIKLDFPPLDYRASKLQTKLFKTSHFQFATTCSKKVKKTLLTINSFHEATGILDVASPSGLPFKRSFSRLTLCCNAWQTGLTIKPRDTGFPRANGHTYTEDYTRSGLTGCLTWWVHEGPSVFLDISCKVQNAHHPGYMKPHEVLKPSDTKLKPLPEILRPVQR